MNIKQRIAQRVAQEISPGSLVNLGIGGFPEGMENPSLTDAGGGYIGALPGAAAFDSAFSFGLIRGGHLDMTVLGGLQVDARGQLANWIIPGKMVPGMGGAMDLVCGAKQVIVAMTHTAKGNAKIRQELTLPKTSDRCVDLIITDLAVIKPSDQGLILLEVAPEVSVDEVLAATEATLIVEHPVKVMAL